MFGLPPKGKSFDALAYRAWISAMKSLGDLWRWPESAHMVSGNDILTPMCGKCGNVFMGKIWKELKNHDEPVDMGYTLLDKPKSFCEAVPSVLLILMKMVSGGWFRPEYV
jgi:hypothetical protein